MEAATQLEGAAFALDNYGKGVLGSSVEENQKLLGPFLQDRAMLRDLAQREINELHVEAGSRLNGALISAGLVDEFLVYLAPKLLGPGMGLAAIGPLTELAQGIALEFVEATPVGRDLRLRAERLARARQEALAPLNRKLLVQDLLLPWLRGV